MAVQEEKVRAWSLWNGERFSLNGEGRVYVIKTYKESGSYVLTTRAERRLTELTSGFFGIGKHWKTWDELNTPVEEQDLDEEVVKVS